jgi:hypothetical protein
VLQLQVALRSVPLPFMPCLEEVKVIVIAKPDLPGQGAIACPVQAVTVARAYVVPAFRLIRTFRLAIEWPASRDSEKSPEGRYLTEGARHAFACLDELLTDERLLESLREVDLDFRPVYFAASDMDDELAVLRTRKEIRKEVLEVFHRTVERVDTFLVTTSPSALK